MKKSIFIILIVLMIALSGYFIVWFTGGMWRTYSSQSSHFSIQVPPGYKLKELQVFEHPVFSWREDEKGSWFEVVVTPSSEEYSKRKPEDSLRERIDNYKKMKDVSGLKSDIRSMTCSGLPAATMEMSYVWKNKETIRTKDIFVKRDKTWWVLHLQYGPKEDVRFEKYVDRIFNSFEILK